MTRLRIDEPATYRITVHGQLDCARVHYIADVTISVRGTPHLTVLTVTVADQAALHGVLRQLYNLGLPLVQLTML